MTKNMPPIPEMNSYQEISEFWDTHSLADYWDQTELTEFQISLNARRRYWDSQENNDDQTSNHND